MPKLLVLVALALFCAQARAEDPELVRSDPADGATNVPIDLGVIRLHFSEEMRRTSWTFWKSDRGEFPPVVESDTPPWRDGRVCEIKVGRLRPDTTYAIQLNCARKGRQGFTAKTGGALPDTVIVFKTAGAAAPRGFDLGPVQPDPDRRWTILLYLDGDNNLEPGACEVLDDFEAALPDGIEVLCLFDRAKGFGDKYGDWTDTRLYRVRRGDKRGEFESEELARLGELNMGDPKVLAAFLAAGLKTFPAKHHCLLMWNHGGGWQEQANDDDARDALELNEFEAALSLGLKMGGVEKLDMVWFWMCLMGQLEIATSTAPYADTMVGSEAIWWLNVVRVNPVLREAFAHDLAPRAMAKRIVEVYGKHYRTKKMPLTMVSAVDLTKIDGLNVAVDAFARKVAPVAESAWPALSRSLFFSESYTGRADYRMGKHATSSIDLMDAAKRIRLAVPAADAEYRRLEAAFDAALIGQYTGPRFRLSHGLAVYGPPRADNFRPDYGKLRFARATAWPQLLQSLHAAQKKGGMRAPVVKDLALIDRAGQPAPAVIPLGGTHVKWTVEGNNLLWMYAQQVKPMKDGLAILYRTFVADNRYAKRRAAAAAHEIDYLMPEYPDGRNEMLKELGGLMFKVTDGRRAFGATIDYSDPSDLRHARVPAIYAHPQQGKARVDIVFNVNWSAAKGIVAYLPQPGGGFTRQGLQPRPDAEITLLYEMIRKDGKVGFAPSGTLKWGKGLMLIPVFQEPGPYAFAVTAESIAGMSELGVLRYEVKPNEGMAPLIKNGSRYTPRQLIGDWKVQVAKVADDGKVQFVDSGLTAHYRVGQEGKVILYEFRGAEQESGMVFVDTRGAPCLSYFQKQGEEWIRTGFHLAFHAVEGEYEFFVVKDVAEGHVYRLVRRGKKPAANLDGVWRANNGWALAMKGGQYESYFNNRLMDRGTYRIDGNKIHTQSQRGVGDVIEWKLENNQLTFRYQSTGAVLVMQRVR